jgi:hypothetical protein
MVLELIGMMIRLVRTAVYGAILLAVASWACAASAQTLSGCASGAAPGRLVYTVSVSASGTPFVTTYVASAPTAGGNAGCAAPSPSAPSVSVNGPGAAAFPLSPGGAVLPATVHMLLVGSSMLMVPVNPSIQVYQIAPGYYVVRSLDPSGNTTVVTPLPAAPQAPNTGPIPSVLH